jgi:hypothetical protein
MTVMGARGWWSPVFALAVIANGCSDAPTTGPLIVSIGPTQSD